MCLGGVCGAPKISLSRARGSTARGRDTDAGPAAAIAADSPPPLDPMGGMTEGATPNNRAPDADGGRLVDARAPAAPLALLFLDVLPPRADGAAMPADGAAADADGAVAADTTPADVDDDRCPPLVASLSLRFSSAFSSLRSLMISSNVVMS